MLLATEEGTIPDTGGIVTLCAESVGANVPLSLSVAIRLIATHWGLRPPKEPCKEETTGGEMEGV